MLDTPISHAERKEVLALVAWFTRRYPTPAERLAYVRPGRTPMSAAPEVENNRR